MERGGLCPRKSSITGLRSELRTVPSDCIPGGNRRHSPIMGISISNDGTQLPLTRIPRAIAHSELAGPCRNGWEWTSTVFAPFRGFETVSLYPGYSADFL
jgi:hypothetical protein